MSCILTDKVEEVFEEEKEEDLGGHCLQRWEGDLVSLHSESFCSRMEEPNLHTTGYVSIQSGAVAKKTYSWQFDGEMRKENLFCAGPLLCWCWHFVRL